MFLFSPVYERKICNSDILRKISCLMATSLSLLEKKKKRKPSDESVTLTTGRCYLAGSVHINDSKDRSFSSV